MRKIEDSHATVRIGTCLLWQEDVRELVDIVNRHTNGGAKIRAGEYEFADLEELFGYFGPRISDLAIASEDQDVSIILGEMPRAYAMNDERHKLSGELSHFFSSRRSLSSFWHAYSVYLFALSAAIAGILSFALLASTMKLPQSFAWVSASFVSICSLLAVFALYGGLMRALLPYGYVTIRNESRAREAFSRRDLFRDYRGRLVFALIGAALAIGVKMLIGLLK